MKKSIFFYKELTLAEVGKTGTHEIYVRLPNNFDFKTFFGNTAVENGSVLEVNFTAIDTTDDGNDFVKLRFVYFKNSNQEKRIPSLGELFKSHNVKEGDIVCLERREEDSEASYFIHFYKAGEIKISPSSVYFMRIGNENICMKISNPFTLPLQQIFYGAPGTGKSHKIKDDEDVKAADEKNLVFRTTFHPDSDYSTFVGAYKPTISKKAVRNVAGDIVKDTNKKDVYEDCITYSFVPQAFQQAYVAAWNNPDDKVFLVIEEINRGNCAQIFGDLFQLLDRDDEGASEYPIMADKDISKYLNGNDEEGRPVLTNKDGIKDGKLRLPKNLYIWATMNTSDQSLFPIDSAFKRRWDWVYMPIADAKKNYVIEIDNDQYDWWSFLEAINAIIESTTHSEDKKLGYFFAKAKDGRITVETFVSKVIFYLWNDVFKDNETNHKAFKDNDGELLPFRKFFHYDGTVDTNMVIKFLQDLEVFPFEHSDDGTTAVSDTTPNTKRQRDKSRYRVNSTDNLNKAQMTREAFRLYIEAHPDADAQTIAQVWNGLGLKDYVQHLVETEDKFIARTKNSTDSNRRATEFELSNGEKIYLSTEFGIGNIGKFIDAVNNAGWNIRIENQA